MQAARGASLSQRRLQPDRPPSVPSARPVRGRLRASSRSWLYAVDQATKWLAVDRLDRPADVELLGDLLGPAPDPQPGRGVQHRHRLHRAASPCWRSSRSLVVLWLSRGSAAALWAVALGLLLAGDRRQPDRPAVPRARAAARPRRGLPACCRTGRSSTSPTCASTSPPALILVQAFRGIRLDGSPRREREPRRAGDDADA